MKRVVLYALKAWWVKCDEVVQAGLKILAPILLFGLTVERAVEASWPFTFTQVWVYASFAVLFTAATRRAWSYWEVAFRKVDPPTD